MPWLPQRETDGTGREAKNMTGEAEGIRQGDTAEEMGGEEEFRWRLCRLGTLGTSLQWAGWHFLRAGSQRGVVLF